MDDNPHTVGGWPWRCHELDSRGFIGRGGEFGDKCSEEGRQGHCWHDMNGDAKMCCGCGQFRDPLLEAMRKASR